MHVSRVSYHSTMKNVSHIQISQFFLLAAQKQQDLDGLVGGERPQVKGVCLFIYIFW